MAKKQKVLLNAKGALVVLFFGAVLGSPILEYAYQGDEDYTEELEGRLEAIESANDIAELYSRAYTVGASAANYCNLSDQDSGRSGLKETFNDTRHLIEELTHYDHREEFPTQEVLSFLDELEQNGVQLIGTDHLNDDILAHFTVNEAGKFLGIYKERLGGYNDEDLASFFRHLSEINYTIPQGQVLSLMSRSKIGGQSYEYIIATGTQEADMIIYTHGDYRFPGEPLPNPCH